MKLIIDIPEDMFEWFKNGEIIDEYDKSALKQVLKNGTPLDDLKAEMFKAYKYVNMYGCGDQVSCFASMLCKILDNIGEESEE